MRKRDPQRWRIAASALVLALFCTGCPPRRSVEDVPQQPAEEAPGQQPESGQTPDVPPPTPPPPPPPTPRPLPDEKSDAEAEALRQSLAESRRLLDEVRKRTLNEAQSEQLQAADAFVEQGADALKEGDLARAKVLADKVRILARDLESATRGG